MAKSNSEIFADFMKHMSEVGSVSKVQSSPQMKEIKLDSPNFNTPAYIPSKRVESVSISSQTPSANIAADPRFEAENKRLEQEIAKLRHQLSSIRDNSETGVLNRLSERKEIIRFICDSMEHIPGGFFFMGSNSSSENNAKPEHGVSLSSFYCMKYPITQSLWLAIGEEAQFDAHDMTPARIDNIGADFSLFLRRLNEITGLEFDLISEAQWEYVARAGRDSKYSGGDYLQDIGEARDSDLGQPNPWGIYGMNYIRRKNGMRTGLAEWCKDMYRNYPTDLLTTLTDPVVTVGSTRCFRSSDMPVYARNVALNRIGNDWREAIWTARLVVKDTSKTSDYIYQNKTFSW